MNKSTTSSLMVVGFFAVVIVASMMFVKKTEAYQNAPTPFGPLMAPTPFGGLMAPMKPVMAPTPFGVPMAPMRPVMAPTPFGGPMAPMRPILAAPTPFGGLMAPTGMFEQKPPMVQPMPVMSPPSGIGSPMSSNKQMQINAMMNAIQRIDTSLLSQTRNVSNNINFLTSTVRQRIQLEQFLRSNNITVPPPPQEVLNLINRIKM